MGKLFSMEDKMFNMLQVLCVGSYKDAHYPQGLLIG